MEETNGQHDCQGPTTDITRSQPMGYCICRCQLPELPPHFSPNHHALGPLVALGYYWLHQCYMPVDPNDRKDGRQEEKRTTEDEMVV